MSRRSKEIIVQIDDNVEDPSTFIKSCINEGIRLFICDPRRVKVERPNLSFIHNSEFADIILIDRIEDIERARSLKKPFLFSIRIDSKEDVKVAIDVAKSGAYATLVETSDWRIIPLENLVAEFQKLQSKLYTRASDLNELKTLFGVLEKGVDGVVLVAKGIDEVKRARSVLSPLNTIELKLAKVIDVRDVGMGDRACIDTTSILSFGDGLLVGNRSNFFFLIHNESIGSEFTSPRPFRVNAGAIHSYVQLPDDKTKYLSEVESGDEVLIVNRDGSQKRVTVGRVKIERRPLILVKAECDGEVGSVIVQNAETIRFVGRDGKLLAVTSLKRGDEVLVHKSNKAGRHFGLSVEEFLLEK
ncbi:MAG: 3-dehydroquinate synthase II [Nitrososphaerota archaeon]|nr:3-dehydroquinate synthase II [Nitrososphaerales archaeon]MDW8044169.1 3-dehydroquinate synthase II [Nitrososphaerota archaeon]